MMKTTLIVLATTCMTVCAGTHVVLDPNSPGRIYEGIGAVSAGASTRNLVDYSGKQRDEVLDLLFKPGFGASLQHLKVEIGGDDNSTCGSEPSHVRSRAELTAPKARGYEFWLMAEARKRNPAIQLDCLPWCYPSWISNRFSQDSADWLVAFLDVARQHYGLEIDWLAAAQNEMGTDMDWVTNILRPTLDRRGYAKVKLQGPDDVRDKWKIFGELRNNPEYDRVLQAVGYHYPSYWLPRIEDGETPVPEEVKATGKPLWSSEEFSLSGKTWGNALLWAQLINKLYIRDRITKVEAWCPVDGINRGILFAGTGLMQANEPWSGHYQVWPAIWTTAHFTQFAHPGWRFLDSACSRFDDKTWTGSHVALMNPATNDWSLIACTSSPQTLRMKLAPGLKRGTVHVWKSTAAEQFVQLSPITISEDSFEIALEKDAVYSITTTTGQKKGGFAEIPASRTFPLPYREDFEACRPGTSPRLLSDQKGTFEAVVRADGGMCLQQMAPSQGIPWLAKVRTPYTVWGDTAWSDYTVKADVLLKGGSVEVGGRYHAEQSDELRSSLATHLVLQHDGKWELLTHKTIDTGVNNYGLRVIKSEPHSLAKGVIEKFDPAVWHTVRVSFQGSSVTAEVDGRTLAKGTAMGGMNGLAYIATSYHPNRFDNLEVTANTADVLQAYPAVPAPTTAPAVPLENAFRAPPASAKPWTYWYWLAGNISAEGVTRDVEAMARAGIGAALMGDINDGPAGPVRSLSPEWWDTLRHAVRECRKNGIEFGMFNSPGWSQSGGPWVTPEDSMQVPVATESVVGPGRTLLVPPRAPGAFRDLALLAIPLSPADSRDARSAGATLSSSPRFPDLPALLDGDPATRLTIPAATAAAPVEIDLAFEKPFSARSLRLVPAARCNLKGELLAADAAGVFQRVASFDFGRQNNKPQNGFLPLGPGVLGFPAIESLRYRVRLTAPATLAELDLSAAPAVSYLVEKQFGKLDKMLIDTPPWPAMAAPAADPAAAVSPRSVIDLTGKLRPDDTLDWTPPPGEWRLLRVALASTGVTNTPATRAACGLEVDKMSRAALGRHLDAFVGKLHSGLAPEDAAAFRYIVADSWEVGGQTWTAGHREWFQERLGYDPVPWLPVLFGHVVGDVERSERFLFDLRRLAADRMALDYAGGLVDLARPLGLRVWLENYGHWGFPIESLQYGGAADMIGGEFWMNGSPRPNASELQAATSAGFLYGKSRVSAEAFTSSTGMTASFSHLPRDYKRLSDWAFSTGVNHLVLHLYIHQPDEGRPGVNAWFGEMFNRHNPWFEMMPGPVAYWRRASALLQRGERIVDLAYFIGEDVPVTIARRIPAPPPGHGAVDINAETLLDRLTVRDGRFVLPHGASFRLLVLPPAERIRPATLRRIRDLVREGGAVLGAPPSASPSLQDYPACDDEVRALASELWAGNDGQTVRETTFGRGRVFRGLGTPAALAALGARPAISWAGGAPLVWIAREESDARIFFVANQSAKPLSVDVSFDSTGRRPEFFQADDGSITPAPSWREHEGRSIVPLALEPFQSVFVVFRAPAAPPTTPAPAPAPLAEFAVLPDTWDVSFAPALGAPFERRGEKLRSWHEHADPAVRHFAGLATYRTRFSAPAATFAELWLDFADLRGAAEVLVNGRSLGHLWTPPFRVRIDGALRPGENLLEIRCASAWHNAVLGARLAPPAPGSAALRLTRPAQLKADAPLQSAGLIGPARLLARP